MKHLTPSRVVIFVATAAFVGWTLLNTILWPLEDYADRVHAYAESTNQIARGMSLGVMAYLSTLGIVLGWHVTRPMAG
jgi:hypothetical protein